VPIGGWVSGWSVIDPACLDRWLGTRTEELIIFVKAEAERAAERRPASAGFRAVLGGGVLLVALTVALRPATDVRGCSNYGGNGNGTAFADGIWDLIYPLLLLGWLVAVVLEQLLPVTWKGRTAGLIAIRAVVAVTIVVVVSCGAGLTLLGLCH
jgi:hypothetical protein